MGEKKFGQGKLDPKKQRGMNEKITDGARGMFEKVTVCHVVSVPFSPSSHTQHCWDWWEVSPMEAS